MSQRTSTVAAANSKQSSSVLGAFQLMSTVSLTFSLRTENDLAYIGRPSRKASSNYFAISKYVFF